MRRADSAAWCRSLMATAGAVVLTLHPGIASAALHLAWNTCYGSPGEQSTINLDCQAPEEHVYELVGTFEHPTFTPTGVVAMDLFLDLLFEAPAVPPFWMLGGFGAPPTCQTLIPVMFDARPVGCTSASSLLCGSGGTRCEPYITAYAWGPSIGFPYNRARLQMAITRGYPPTPVDLPPQRYFAFTLRLYQSADEGESLCDGCDVKGAITWNQAVLYNAQTPGAAPEGIAAAYRSSDPGSQPNVGINCAPGTCLTVSNRATTWGRLKALYR